MIDLFSVDEPDLDAIAAKQQQILDGKRKMQQFITEHLLEAKELLTKEQQKEIIYFTWQGFESDRIVRNFH